MRAVFILICFFVVTPAIAGPFDISPVTLKKKLGTTIDSVDILKKKSAQPGPQECDRKGELTCDVTIFGQMVTAYGTEFPPKTRLIAVVPWKSSDGDMVKYGIMTVQFAFDPRLDAKGFGQVLNAFANCWNDNRDGRVEGVEARYYAEVIKTPSITGCSLNVTPH